MTWQSHVRWQCTHQKYGQIIVCSTAGHESLYPSVAKFIPHNIKGERNCHMIKNPSANDLAIATNTISDNVEELKQVGYTVDLLTPTGTNLYLNQQLHVPFGNANAVHAFGKFDVLLHARTREYRAEANYALNKWLEIAAALQGLHLNVASIGTTDAAHLVPGTVDLRGLPLPLLMDAMASAKLVVGPSSGPMHLASLCKTKHVVWSHMKIQSAIGCTNRERYERVWNPLHTPVRFIPEPAPTPALVFQAISELLRT
jgi:hypothetical protein